MPKHKIGLVGYLGYAVENPIIGGQMSKTRGIYDQLKKQFGEDSVIVVDTSNWKKEKFKLVMQCLKVAFKCKPVIIMPNKNGIKFVLPFFSSLKGLCGYKIAYPVVGGWLTGLLKKHNYLAKGIKKVDYILPETKALMNELKEFADCPIEVMPIFSTRTPVDEKSIKSEFSEPIKFCTFSRVTPEKGIDDAIKAIQAVNEKVQRQVCKLDIYGPIDPNYTEHYNALFDERKDFVSYKGVLSGDDSLTTLSEYYMLLFPTYYPGEGFPTTVCESFMSGLPVIASDWRFNNELVANDETGYLVPAHDTDKLAEKIIDSINNQDKIIEMSNNCLEKSKEYQPERVMKSLSEWIVKNNV